MLPILDEVLKKEVLRLYPAYEDIHPEVFVRISELPIIDQIRDIRQSHLNCMIKITRRQWALQRVSAVEERDI